MKQTFLAILCTIICVLGLGMTIASAERYESLEITLVNEEVIITDCFSYTDKEIIIPDEIAGYPVTTIGERAFAQCRSVNIVMPETIKTIEREAFYDCSNLTNINLPDSVVSIDDFAFSSCAMITSIEIPINVEEIGVGVFHGCEMLAEIVVSDDNDYYCSENGALFNKDKTVLKAYPKGREATSYIVPVGVEHIDKHAFDSCDRLESITIPDSVKSIGSYAFMDCSSLKSITIPDGVTTIEPYVFFGCYNLTGITIPNSVATIGYRAFNDCMSLGDVYYSGTKNDWGTIQIDRLNDYLTNATIHYLDGTTSKDASTSTTIEDNTYIVTPNNIESGYVIIFACYKDKSLVYRDIYTYENENEITFTPNEKHDKVKIMVWESITNLKPICGAEEILLTT